MKEIYLDNSATTRVCPEAVEVMSRVMLEDYGNPSSMHCKGMDAERYVKEARSLIADTLKVSDKEILFTSCGTEADNMALMGCARANRRKGRHIITTMIEHPAVLRTVEQLIREDFEVTYLNVDKNGLIDPDMLKEAIREDTILVSIMHVNNEIGAVQPIAEAGALIKSVDPEILFHVDAVQGYGKIRLNPKKMNIDLMSVSGHKIHGPKGIGFLYIRDGVKISPILYGGGQQNLLRSGTENVPGIAAIGKAASLIHEHLEEDALRLYGLKKDFIGEMRELDEIFVNGVPAATEENLPGIGDPEENIRNYGAPHIISISVPGVRSEVLLHALEEKGIFVSSGSACAARKKSVSDTLSAIGLSKERLDATIRISMSVYTVKEEMDETVKAIREIVPFLRRYRAK